MAERNSHGLLPVAHHWSFSHLDYGLILDEVGENHATLEGDTLTLKPALRGQGLLTKASGGTVVNAGRLFLGYNFTLGLFLKYDIYQGQVNVIPFQCNQDWPYQPSLFELAANYTATGNLQVKVTYAYLSGQNQTWTSHVISASLSSYSGAFIYISLSAAKIGRSYTVALHADGNEIGSGIFTGIPGRILHGCMAKINSGNFTGFPNKLYYIDEVFLWKSAFTSNDMKNVTAIYNGKCSLRHPKGSCHVLDIPLVLIGEAK